MPRHACTPGARALTYLEEKLPPAGSARALGPVAEQRLKQLVRSLIGEVYVGKRLKLRWLTPALNGLALDPTRILDAGAEDATFTYWLADRYPRANVVAVDVDRAAVEACRAARPERYATRVEFVAGTFADLPASSFDLVTAFDVLEHIGDDLGALRELRNVLVPAGTLLIHVPTNPYTDHKGRRHWIADDDAWKINAGHVRHGYEPDDLRQRVESAGFEVIAVDRWNRHWSTWAHDIYARLENPAVLRLLTVPVTDVLAALDRRRPTTEGNTLWMVARRLSF
ncbi:MAG: class I SAM-dependent methyltransferase [Actinobacteria bacterium]|nr:class I SAM-dependent methyltransferase [Actinomycetota bacterium]